MRIGELAKQTGHTTDTVRFYEKEGLLPPGIRLSNNYRDYGPAHEARLLFIRRCRSLSLGLDEIKWLLSTMDDPSGEKANRAHSVIDAHLHRVDEQIEELKALREALLTLRGTCQGGHECAEDCGLWHRLVGDESGNS